MTKKENFRRKQYFSIRKYKMGACSVLLGTSLFLSLSYTGEAKATEEKEVCIHAVDNSSLSEQIKSQLKVFEENKITVEEGKSYYFVYKKNNILPSTGGVTLGTTVLGGALLLVCLTLIKKKKGKLIFLVSMLTVGGNLSQVMAFEDFKEIQPVVIKTSIGGMLPSPEEIPGYSFTGYYFETGNTCTNKSSSIKIEERGGFTPGLVEEKVAVSEKGEPLREEALPELVVSEKGKALREEALSELVVSEKGEALIQESAPIGKVENISDGKSGVEVELFNNKIDNISLNVKAVKDAQQLSSISKELSVDKDKVRILDLKLSKDNNVVHLNNERIVRIALLENESSEIEIYHVDKTGKLTLIPSEVNNKVVQFNINHFSLFAIVDFNKKEKSKENKLSTNNNIEGLGSSHLKKNDSVETRKENSEIIRNNIDEASYRLNDNLEKININTIQNENDLNRNNKLHEYSLKNNDTTQNIDKLSNNYEKKEVLPKTGETSSEQGIVIAGLGLMIGLLGVRRKYSSK